MATTFHSQLSLDEQLVERAGQGDADGIEQLLAIGANPKAFGVRALLLAAETGRADCLSLLISRSSTIANAKALILAATEGRIVSSCLLPSPTPRPTTPPRFQPLPLAGILNASSCVSRFPCHWPTILPLFPPRPPWDTPNARGSSFLHQIPERENPKPFTGLPRWGTPNASSSSCLSLTPKLIFAEPCGQPPSTATPSALGSCSPHPETLPMRSSSAQF